MACDCWGGIKTCPITISFLLILFVFLLACLFYAKWFACKVFWRQFRWCQYGPFTFIWHNVDGVGLFGIPSVNSVFSKAVTSDSSVSDVPIPHALMNIILTSSILYTVGAKLENCRYWSPHFTFYCKNRNIVPSPRFKILWSKNNISAFNQVL